MLKVHHIGYLLENMSEAIKTFSALGYVIEHNVVYDSIRRVDICFMHNGDTVIELVVPREDCVLFTTLKKRIGNAPYHICYECMDILKTGRKLENMGWHMVQPPQIAVAIADRMVSFYYHPDVGMIELVDNK